MKLTIAFITARPEPHLEWLVNSLEPHASVDDQIEILVIDALWPRPLPSLAASDAPLEYAVGVSSIRSMLPKPNIWQGKHRIAPRDFFANANARNTAIVYCRTDYIVFLDDRARLTSTWLDVVRDGERRNRIVCGPYDKIEDGPIDTHRQIATTQRGQRLSTDSRRVTAPKGNPNAPGGWLFGGNFAAPLPWLLDVNGCEEGCDPTGQEDCVLGLMLANRGHAIEYRNEMCVLQDRTGDVHVPAFPRLDKGPSPHDRSHATIARFGKRRRTEFTPDLRALRELAAAGKPLPIPNPAIDHRDWYDNQPIRETESTP